jgi:uncharacterized membrane protein YkvA (DUF1232 family)
VSTWGVVGAVVGGVVLLWALLVLVLWLTARRESRRVDLRELLRLVPDLMRLVTRLARDPSLPRCVRVRLVLLLGYLALPIDLVPDVIPVVGYADDVVVVALMLRSVVRRAGPDAIEQHWPGTDTGLAAVLRLAGVAPEPT